jgi:hypothetical protein
VRVDETPITPDKVLRALKAAQEKGPARGVGVTPTRAPSPWPSRLITWQPSETAVYPEGAAGPIPAKGSVS